MNDWTGNSMASFVTNGDSSHSKNDREEHDFYATPPEAVRMLIEECEPFLCEENDEESIDDSPLDFSSLSILEPCCGSGHIVRELESLGYSVFANDLYNHGFNCSNKDFLTEINYWGGDIITNPPYKYAKEFVEHALDIVPEGRKVAMFLKLSFLEGQNRWKLFNKYPPKRIYVSVKRLNCGKNGIFEGSSAVCYCWYVWVKGFKGEPTIRWFNY